METMNSNFYIFRRLFELQITLLCYDPYKSTKLTVDNSKFNKSEIPESTKVIRIMLIPAYYPENCQKCESTSL